MIRTLLVTNDFPPKIGGIQSYLGELWTRLEPSSTAVLTATSDRSWADHDARAALGGLQIERTGTRLLWAPTRTAARAVDAAIERFEPELVLYDPFVPLGLLGERAGVPYGVVLHGAEVTFPARLPALAAVSRRVLAGASVALCAGGYPEDEARRVAGDSMPPTLVVPPGVDTARYVALPAERRGAARARLGLPSDGPVVATVGRLVPRKGVDVLIEAMSHVAAAHPDVTLAVAGTGRDEGRLRRIARHARARVHFLGRISERDKVELLGAADVFCQPCRSRWGGLEQEGFGIVFLEAAACATPQVAGRSGGSHEAVVDGATGRIVDDPTDPVAVSVALLELLSDEPRRAAMGDAARGRAVAQFGYDRLARTLQEGLERVIGEPGAARS